MKVMLSLLAEELTDFLMSNHTYSVGDTIYLQLKGGPIGIDITRVLARIMMILFDNRFKLKIDEIKEIVVRLHMRYVDDENLAVDVEVEDDDDIEEVTETVSNLLQDTANNIFPEMFSMKMQNCFQFSMIFNL